MRYNSSWNWKERRRFSFNPVTLCGKKWKYMCWLQSLCWQAVAFTTMASKTKTSGFWTTCPPQYHSVKRHAYLRQIGDSEASTRTVCTQAEVRWQSSGNWLDSLAKLCHVVIFGGSVLWFGEPQITNLTTCNHQISTLFPCTYDTRWLIDGKFRGVAAKMGCFVSIAMFRGGRRQISRGAASKYQYWHWTTMIHKNSMERAPNANL